ncbi:MAG: sigma-54 dependent transcriptional regulator [Bdellovibrionota bacterium]
MNSGYFYSEDFEKLNIVQRLRQIESHINSIPEIPTHEVQYLNETLRLIVDEILSLRKDLSETEEKFASLSTDLVEQWNFENIVGKSEAMQGVFKLLHRIMDSESTILITGENGTGKEGIAKAIHFNSKRKDNSFVIQNCGAINDNLLESELFGHVKGAFTSAIRDKKGLFELANNGTLFLDEIGDTSPAMQVKLLRVLEEGTFIYVGGSEQKKVDVRVLVATNKNLEQMVKDGTFREDLYYRLNVINIKLPALKERKEDIPLLINKFLEEYCNQNKLQIKKITTQCIRKMEKYDWPGNVRELKNEVERLCVLSGSEINIDTDLLSEKIYDFQGSARLSQINLSGSLKDALVELEKNMIYQSLLDAKWNKSRAAKKLGISRANLITKCEKYGFTKDNS